MDNATLRWRYCQNCDVYPNCGGCDVKKEIEKNDDFDELMDKVNDFVCPM